MSLCSLTIYSVVDSHSLFLAGDSGHFCLAGDEHSDTLTNQAQKKSF